MTTAIRQQWQLVERLKHSFNIAEGNLRELEDMIREISTRWNIGKKSFKRMDRASVISGRASVQSGCQQERRWGGRRHAWRIRKISKWIETINKQHHWILSTSNVKKMVPVIITLPQDSGKEENLKSLGKTLRMRIECRLLSSHWHSEIFKVLKE